MFCRLITIDALLLGELLMYPPKTNHRLQPKLTAEPPTMASSVIKTDAFPSSGFPKQVLQPVIPRTEYLDTKNVVSKAPRAGKLTGPPVHVPATSEVASRLSGLKTTLNNKSKVPSTKEAAPNECKPNKASEVQKSYKLVSRKQVLQPQSGEDWIMGMLHHKTRTRSKASLAIIVF